MPLLWFLQTDLRDQMKCKAAESLSAQPPSLQLCARAFLRVCSCSRLVPVCRVPPDMCACPAGFGGFVSGCRNGASD